MGLLFVRNYDTYKLFKKVPYSYALLVENNLSKRRQSAANDVEGVEYPGFTMCEFWHLMF